jgi:IS5 family transposase
MPRSCWMKFGFTKARYSGLNKNANRLFATLALVNLFTVRNLLAAASA